MKEYFSHDYFSRNDPRILKLRMKLKWEGVGLYWALVEIAYENAGIIESNSIESLAFDLRTQCERITDVLQSYDLFYLDGENYRSHSIDRRLGLRSERSEKAKKSAEARWNKSNNQIVNANAMRTQCDSNAIKEKESKEKESKEEDTYSFESFWNEYHDKTGKPKSDKEPALKKWNRLSKAEKKLAIDKISEYAKTNVPEYLKKARTYLEDKSFNDEMKPRVIQGNFNGQSVDKAAEQAYIDKITYKG